MTNNVESSYRPPHNATQGVPRPLIKPVKEIVEAMLYHVVGGPIVEPRNTHKPQLNTNESQVMNIQIQHSKALKEEHRY